MSENFVDDTLRTLITSHIRIANKKKALYERKAVEMDVLKSKLEVKLNAIDKKETK